MFAVYPAALPAGIDCIVVQGSEAGGHRATHYETGKKCGWDIIFISDACWPKLYMLKVHQLADSITAPGQQVSENVAHTTQSVTA